MFLSYVLNWGMARKKCFFHCSKIQEKMRNNALNSSFVMKGSIAGLVVSISGTTII